MGDIRDDSLAFGQGARKRLGQNVSTRHPAAFGHRRATGRGCRSIADRPTVNVLFTENGEIPVPIIDLGSSVLNLANVVTSIAANVTYILHAWGLA